MYIDFSRQVRIFRLVSAVIKKLSQDCMTPIDPLDSSYLFDQGKIRLRYISKHPYQYAGSSELDLAKAHLLVNIKRRTSCNIEWFRVPGWVFLCPKYTIGMSTP